MTDTARGHNGPTDFLPKLLTVWREGYRLADLRADALAGLTVAIVALPLSMAIAMMPVPQQFALPKANEAFDEAGALKDAKHQAALDAVVGSLLRVAAALKPAA